MLFFTKFPERMRHWRTCIMKHSHFIRAVLCFTMLCLLFTFFIPTLTPVSAASQLTGTVNISRPQKNMRGPGYDWDNIHDVLTLDGLNINTTDDYGLRITDNATVILKGKNYIKASKAALTCQGSVTFKGDGTLTLVSDDMGIYFYSSDTSTTARFLEGTFDITAGGDGIRSDSTFLSLTGSNVTIHASNPEHWAIACHSCKLFGGKIIADNAVNASFALEVRGLRMELTAQKPALTSAQKLAITDVAIQAGSSADARKSVDEYNGEFCVSMKSTAVTMGNSIFFGESVPAFVDALLIIFLLLLIAAGIGLPFLRARQKAKKALAAAAEVQNAAPVKKNRR